MFAATVVNNLGFHLQSRRKKGPKGSTRNLPGGQHDPGERQEIAAAKSAPRAPQGRPTSASERPWRPPGAHLAPDSTPETSRKPFQSSSKRIPHPSANDFRQFFTLRKASAKRCLLPGRLFVWHATAKQADATGNSCCPGPRRDLSNSIVGLVRRRTEG